MDVYITDTFPGLLPSQHISKHTQTHTHTRIYTIQHTIIQTNKNIHMYMPIILIIVDISGYNYIYYCGSALNYNANI